MKKLLSILAAVGLTATASAGVVACTSVNTLLSDLQINKDGNATFKLHQLEMKKDYASIDDVKNDYAVFAVSGKDYTKVNWTSFTSTANPAVTSFTKGHKYNFSGSFKIDGYDNTKNFAFVFGTVKDGKLDANLGTLTIMGLPDKGNGGKGTKKEYTFKGSFKAKFAAGTTVDNDALQKAFVITGPDGKTPVENVTYSWTPSVNDSENQQNVSFADTAISGTVGFSYKTESASSDQKVSIDKNPKSDLAKKLDGWEPIKNKDITGTADSGNDKTNELTISADLFTKTKGYEVFHGQGQKPMSNWLSYAQAVQQKLWNAMSADQQANVKKEAGISDVDDLNTLFTWADSDQGENLLQIKSGTSVDRTNPNMTGKLQYWDFGVSGTIDGISKGSTWVANKTDTTNKFVFVFESKTKINDTKISSFPVSIMTVIVNPAK